MAGRDRQRELARAKMERQMAKRAAAARRRRRAQAAVASVIGVVVLVAAVTFAIAKLNGGDDNPTAAASAGATPAASAKPTTPSASPTQGVFPTTTFAARTGKAQTTDGACQYAEPSKAPQNAKYLKDVGLPPDPKKELDSGKAVVNVKTNQGNMQFTLDRSLAPCAVQSTVYLITKSFFNNTYCPRLTSQSLYVLQCGDPSSTQQGGPTYTYKQEPPKKDYTAGSIAMANTGQAKSTASQFFINYKASKLPKQYSLIGSVSKGMDVLNKIVANGVVPGVDPQSGKQTTTDGKPKQPVKIISMDLAN